MCSYIISWKKDSEDDIKYLTKYLKWFSWLFFCFFFTVQLESAKPAKCLSHMMDKIFY